MQESAAWTSVLVDGQDQASCDRSDGGCAQEGPSLSLLQNHAVGVAAKGSAASVAASISGESPSRRRDDGASSIDVALRSLAYLPSYAIAELMGGVVAACVFRATHAAEFAEKA
mmetsp:Transcript_109092/g.336762  ORF Transcript_109092/g.336762 Transcript_109092/m.336762 type:complete len:114 (-) Transcript_109092:129-470(-)